MRPNLYGMAAAAALTFTNIPAQTIDAIAVHFPQPVVAGGRVLPAGNYTVSTLKGVGEVPVLRFQSETGESIAILVTREYLPPEQVAKRSEVLVVPNGADGLRIDRVVMEGASYRFQLPLTDFNN